MCDKKGQVRVLELYSGIGGMHYSLLELHETRVIAALDISPLTTVVYQHNFPCTFHMEKGVEGLSVEELDKLQFDMLLMSPPCQPFTRLGMKKDAEDPRTKSFFHLMDLLKKLKFLPKYILLENVKGFEESITCARYREVLTTLSYHQQGFLVSPKHLGIPNSRLRYYHLAVRKPLCFNRQWFKPERVLEFIPNFVGVSNETCSTDADQKACCRTLNEYLEDPEAVKDFMIPTHVCDRYLPVMDVVIPNSTNSTCFTKSYGHYVEGTGSVLNISSLYDTNSYEIKSSQNLELRYFSPREIANLMGFPKSFSFPSHLTRKQRYRLLGNSLNVRVVSQLVKILLRDVYEEDA